MFSKVQKIYKQLRELETEASQMVPTDHHFRRVENKIMVAANAVGDWLNSNKALAPKPEPKPVEKPTEPPAPTKAPTT